MKSIYIVMGSTWDELRFENEQPRCWFVKAFFDVKNALSYKTKLDDGALDVNKIVGTSGKVEYSVHGMPIADEDVKEKVPGPCSSGVSLVDIDYDCGDHMTLTQFQRAVRDGIFNDDDGFGEYATTTQVSNIRVYPSDVPNNINPKWSHVVWYNK